MFVANSPSSNASFRYGSPPLTHLPSLLSFHLSQNDDHSFGVCQIYSAWFLLITDLILQQSSSTDLPPETIASSSGRVLLSRLSPFCDDLANGWIRDPKHEKARISLLDTCITLEDVLLGRLTEQQIELHFSGSSWFRCSGSGIGVRPCKPVGEEEEMMTCGRVSSIASPFRLSLSTAS